MDLNQLKLSPHTLTALYKNLLVNVNDPGHAAENLEEKTSWKFLGENRRNILIVVNYAETMHIPDEQLRFLINLLTACKLNLGDVAVLNFQNYRSADYNRIMDHFKPKVVLLFDTKPGEFGMPMNFPEFQVQAYTNTLFVSSPSLELIEPDKTLKGKLWVCLKKIFNL